MARSAFAWVPLILTAGAIVLLFFVILGGIRNTTPLNHTFFLSVSKGSSYDHWTLWQTCSGTGATTVTCPHANAAYPFNISNYIPSDTGNFYYYMSRFSFAFYLIGLVFAVVALVLGLLALCSRLGGALGSVFAFLALFFTTAAAALMTAWTVIARNKLNSAGHTASLGTYAYGFSWGAVGALFLASFFFCCVACGRRRSDNRDVVVDEPIVADGTTRRRFWQRREKTAFDNENAANGAY